MRQKTVMLYRTVVFLGMTIRRPTVGPAAPPGGGEEPQSNRHISPAVYISTLCIFVSHHFLQPITYHEFQDIDHQLYRHVGDRLHVFV